MELPEPRRTVMPPQDLRKFFKLLCETLERNKRFIRAAEATATVNAATVKASAAAVNAVTVNATAATEATAVEEANATAKVTACRISEEDAIGLIGFAILAKQFLDCLQAMTDMTSVMKHFKTLENLLNDCVPGLDISGIPFELEEIAESGDTAKKLCEFLTSCMVSGDFIKDMHPEHFDGVERAAKLHISMFVNFPFLNPDDVSAKLFSYNFSDRIKGYRKLIELYGRICLQRLSCKVSADKPKPKGDKLQIVKLFEQHGKASGSSC
jgi:hypothetical protein